MAKEAKGVKVELVDLVKILEQCNRAAKETQDPKWSPSCNTCILYPEVWLEPNAEFYGAINGLRVQVSPCMLVGEILEAVENDQKRRQKRTKR